jgi:hypothetical protein
MAEGAAGRESAAWGGPAGGGGSLPASGGAGLGLALAEALGQVALDLEAVALLGDQPGDRGGGFRQLEGDRH